MPIKDPRQSRWRHRFYGLAFALLVLLGVEALCRVAGWGKLDPTRDPFVGFDGTVPLFTVDPLTNTHVTAPERLKFFIEDRFPRMKSDETIRIFCLGGSTVQGRPYSIETSFSSWLRLSLSAAYPDKRWEVVNCGGVSYASYRLIPILAECLQYQPDLIILCTGHNEFLEERSYAALKRMPKPLQVTVDTVSHLNLFRLMEQSSHRFLGNSVSVTESRPILKTEVDALLDYRGGLAAYERDDPWRDGVMRHYEVNVRRMFAMARDAKVPLLCLDPPSNLKDCPPFKSTHREGLMPEQVAAFENLVTEARGHYENELPQAVALLKQALTLDQRHASTHYALGQCYLKLADPRAAEASLIRALEEDICPLRIMPRMRKALQALCQDFQVDLINAPGLLAEHCAMGILGDEILVDHVHPSIHGHQLIAEAIHEHLTEIYGAPASQDWKTIRKESYRRHLESLDPLYFAHGQQRLNNLHAWTQGRADGPRIDQRLQRLSKDKAP